MKKKRNNSRAARKAARVKPPTKLKKEEVKTYEVAIEETKKESFTEEVMKPIVRMLGHTLSAAFAYGVWCVAEIVVARTLSYIFKFGTPHQAELFEMGESILFYAGFAIWAVAFGAGAIRMVLAEVKLFGKD